MDSQKELRIELAKKISVLKAKMMMLGTWDYQQINALRAEIDELDAQRIATFGSKEAYDKWREELNAGRKAVWSGCYTDYIGYGAGPKGGWPERDCRTAPEWKMHRDYEAMVAAEREASERGDFSEKKPEPVLSAAPSGAIVDLKSEVERLRKHWGVKGK